ncbi:MAG TPA: bifunctional 4-hydroxy-2-oxoglutarate aldolase/2-dehydro-3-deoxy-phosphogluconate aldolase [Hyphomonadaceae bacterium]|nr:bifunctional 4-hydroxy-2-oxoglutarate aldolase/2-dehydro-3-deoxy-phosphogluconate aldolase [Hyphomonadaceae bacterium]HPN05594.1 bifunctional 4-hydroxy-2-oxoglutarate aldolase/2-dehydro-3-deoxy-phosphogluconate aldolase [Hyphomonadaceae bacterium]
MTVDELMAIQPVIPVITIERVEDAVPLAEALVGAGLPVLEVTLRTAAGAASIKAMNTVRGAIAGAGTVIDRKTLDTALDNGAQFIVTPGLSPDVTRETLKARVPILPGIATPTELMAGLDLGLTRFKFFPAEQAGGRAMLDALKGPFGQVKFCPTGGITLDLARDYLTRTNVACVGGGWLTPKKLIDAKQWDEIGKLAREAAALTRG